MASNRAVAVGAFVLGGALLFGVGLFLIGDRRLLFAETFRVYAEFSKIASLDNGAKVRVAGMDAGEVESIRVPTSPSGKFRVRMRIREDLHPLIRLDAVASIQNDGLVGNKFVQIESGSEQQPEVPDQGTIQGREPFDIADLMQQMRDTITTVNTMLDDVKADVDATLDTVTAAAGDARELLDDVGGDVRVIMASTKSVVGDLNAIVTGVRKGEGTIGKLVTDDALYQRVRAIAADAEKAVANVREASEQAKGAVADFRGEGGPLKGVAGDLQQTLATARESMSDLAEATEALKRNFFFRGFFNRRGFFDLDDVTVAQYREGALVAGDRRALRIWLGADVVFERDANGLERLGDGGRVRLDSAMSTFVGYAKSTPIVVEGYAQEITGDERYLHSRARAKLVRDYIVSKFALDPNYVGVMPMGSAAEGSPSGSTWNGVAIAAFVPVGDLERSRGTGFD
jgi:phospholipid/cholesterol/gamma-HCH transport system substrate-binding protein